MHRFARIGLLLVAATALAACSGNQRYSVSRSSASSSGYPATYTPTAYAPAPVITSGVTSVTFDLARTDRQSADAAALRYCGDQGRTAAFRSIDGYAITYDCVPASDYGATAALPMAVPSITFDAAGTDPYVLQEQAHQFCARQGLGAAYRGHVGDRVTYDCVGGVTTASMTSPMASGPVTPAAVPTITYETAGDSRTPAEAAAIKYCASLGLSPVLRNQEGRRVTYECH